MATLYLLCGLPGSGKTTLAKQLEISETALRLCPDEWIVSLLSDPTDTNERDRLRDPVEKIQWEVAKKSLVLGINVVLENGFWSREERNEYRSQAEPLGAQVKLIYLNVSIEELWKRLSKRNENLPEGTFKVSKKQLELWASWFETPTSDELSK